MKTGGEISGFLNWALEGLKRLKLNGWEFSNSRSTEEIKEDYIRKSSPIQAFIMDCVDIISDSQVVKQELFTGFAEYCRKLKLPIVTKETFFRNLPIYVTIADSKPEINGKQVHCFKGIELRPREKWSYIKEEKRVDMVDIMDMDKKVAS